MKMKYLKLVVLQVITWGTALSSDMSFHVQGCTITSCYVQGGTLQGYTVESKVSKAFKLLSQVNTDYKKLEKYIEAADDINLYNSLGETLLVKAAHYNDEKAIDALLKHPRIDVNLTNVPWKQTPLLMAIGNNSSSIVTKLLSKGVIKPDEEDLIGYGPLHYSALNGYPAITALLLGAKADINSATKKWGETPLMLAIRNRDLQERNQDQIETVCELLNSETLAINKINFKGETAFDYTSSSDDVVIALLRKKGALSKAELYAQEREKALQQRTISLL